MWYQGPTRRHLPGVALIALFGVSMPAGADAMTRQVLGLYGGEAHLEVDDSSTLHAADAVTITAWFRTDELRSWQALVWKGDLPDRYPFKNREFGVYLQASGYVHLCSTPVSRQHRGQLYINTPGGRVETGRWHHVAAVLSSDADGGSMRIYLDGELAASRPYDRSPIRDTTGPLWIGAIPGGAADFHGLVDEVQLWQRALSGDEIRSRMNTALRGDERGLMAYYRFDGLDASGAVADASGRGQRGRLVGDAYLRTIQLQMPPLSDPLPVVIEALPTVPVVAATTTTTTSASASGATTTTTTTTPVSAPVVARVVLPAPLPTLLVPPSLPSVPTPGGQIRGDEAYLVVQALGSHDADVRRRAANAFDRLHPTVEEQVLRVALESHDADVRRRAADCLARVSRAAFIPLVGLALESHDTLVRRRAADALDAAPRRWGEGWDDEPMPAPVAAVSDWRPERYEGWEHKWSAERPDFWDLETTGFKARYNRVEGAYLGWRQARDYENPAGIAHFFELGRGLANDRWRYQVGGELFTFYGPPAHSSNLATIGGEVHDLTDTQDGWLVSEEENTLEAALFRRDYRDYYRRRGASVYSSHNIGGVLQVTGRWSQDRFASMTKATDWSLFEERWSDPVFRDNPAVDEGTVVAARVDVQLDTRNRRGDPSQGWFINTMTERAGGVLGGDHRFKRYLLDLRRYQPAGRGTRLDLRLRGGTAKGDLPDQFRYRLGGFGSLRGYDYKLLEGDRSLLVNAQYWIDADRHWHGDEVPVDGLGFGVFFDAGAAWDARHRSDPFDGFYDLVLGAEDGPDWKRTVGVSVGTADDGFRVDLAHPLDADPLYDAGGWSVTARVSRAF